MVMMTQLNDKRRDGVTDGKEEEEEAGGSGVLWAFERTEKKKKEWRREKMNWGRVLWPGHGPHA